MRQLERPLKSITKPLKTRVHDLQQRRVYQVVARAEEAAESRVHPTELRNLQERT